MKYLIVICNGWDPLGGCRRNILNVHTMNLAVWCKPLLMIFRLHFWLFEALNFGCLAPATLVCWLPPL